MASHDGVGSGLYKSLARPGGNITGSESMAPELDAKRVEILKDILPQLSHLTILQIPRSRGQNFIPMRFYRLLRSRTRRFSLLKS